MKYLPGRKSANTKGSLEYSTAFNCKRRN